MDGLLQALLYQSLRGLHYMHTPVALHLEDRADIGLLSLARGMPFCHLHVECFRSIVMTDCTADPSCRRRCCTGRWLDMLKPTGEDAGAMAGSICQVGARAVLLVTRGAAKAAVAAGVRSAAVARDLAAVHAQLLQASLQLLVGLAMLLNTCRRHSPPIDPQGCDWDFCHPQATVDTTGLAFLPSCLAFSHCRESAAHTATVCLAENKPF